MNKMENENVDFNFDDYIVYDDGVDELENNEEFENKCIDVILDSIKNSGGNIVAIENNPGLILTNGTMIHGSRSIYDEISSTQFFATSSKDLANQAQNDEIMSSEACNTLQNIFHRVCEDQPIIIESEVLPDGTLPLDDPKLTYVTQPTAYLKNPVQLGGLPSTIIRGCDIENMTIQTSDFPKSAKKLCCNYCYKSVAKLARHIEYVHKDEPDVIKFRYLPKNSKERKDIIATIRKFGTLVWNKDATLNNGLLITARRPKSIYQKKASDYTACITCRGTYLKTNIRHHRCNRVQKKGERQILVQGRLVEGRIHENANDRMRFKIIPVMREDDIVRLIRYDWLIVLLGNKLCMKYTPHYQENYIRSQLRLAGRILYALRNINSNVSDFASIYDTSHYNDAVDAIRVIAGFDSTRNEFGSPKTATTAVTLLKRIGKTLATEYIILKNENKQKDTNNFLYVMDEDIGISINKPANDTQDRMRREKKDNIPTDEDVKAFSEYLHREMNKFYKVLGEDYCYTNWLHLLELTAASIMVFNRRRVGDTQNILLSEFLVRDCYDEELTQYATLSDEAKAIAKTYSRMTVRGKRGRTVQVLLKPDMDESVQRLLQYREEVGVSPSNEFLFGLPTSAQDRTKVLDVCAAIRKLSDQCGASNPGSLRGTNLRKHIATLCASLNLDDNNVADVANFMGHSEKIHREFYRRNPFDRQVANISKILETGQGKKDSEDYIKTEISRKGTEMCNSFGSEVMYETSSAGKRKYESQEKDDEPVPKCKPVNSFQSDVKHEKPSIVKQKNDLQKKEGEPIQKRRKVRYSEIELQAMQNAFKHYFETRTNPSTAVVERMREEFDELKGRTVPQIKTWINNKIKGGQPSKRI